MAKSLPSFGAGAPAILGGDPIFPEGLRLIRPRVPEPDRTAEKIASVLKSGLLTNGAYVRELEQRAAQYLGVRHCVAVSSCTSGLMLALKTSELTGDVVLPSFTFAATAHSAVWNGLSPAFADIDPETLTLSPQAARHGVGMRTSAILATHTYGTPCDVERLAEVARQDGIRLFFDAAHAFGSRRAGVPVGGFGDAEVFSLSPTKVMTGAEGGIISTNDDLLAERCRIGRDYGNPGDYDCRFVGLNARMSEIHAIVALSSFNNLEERIDERNVIARIYQERLERVSGVSFPKVAPQDRSTFKDFTVLIETDQFGIEASALAKALAAEGIECRRYYSPPVHEMQAYISAGVRSEHLPVTNWAAERVLTLPLWSGMNEDHVDRVGGAIERINRFAVETL